MTRRTRTEEEQARRREKLGRFVFWVVLFSFAAAMVYCVIRIPGAPAHDEAGQLRTKADYFLMLLEAAIGLLGLFLPDMLARRIQFHIPSGLYFCYVLFLYGSMFLGEVRHFYYTVPHWDTILHGFSGLMIGALGFCVVSQLNKSDRVRMALSPGFVALFAFCFAAMVGALWEICEFSIDGVFGLNMQKFALEDGTQLVGRRAVSDTMKDLIVDCVGAGIMSLAGYLSLKYRKGWARELFLSRNKKPGAPGVEK